MFHADKARNKEKARDTQKEFSRRRSSDILPASSGSDTAEKRSAAFKGQVRLTSFLEKNRSTNHTLVMSMATSIEKIRLLNPSMQSLPRGELPSGEALAECIRLSIDKREPGGLLRDNINNEPHTSRILFANGELLAESFELEYYLQFSTGDKLFREEQTQLKTNWLKDNPSRDWLAHLRGTFLEKADKLSDLVKSNYAHLWQDAEMEIVDWSVISSHPQYTQEYANLQNKCNQGYESFDPAFLNKVYESAKPFLERLNFTEINWNESIAQSAIRYVLKECAGVRIMAKLGYGLIMYPGAASAAMADIMTTIAREKSEDDQKESQKTGKTIKSPLTCVWAEVIVPSIEEIKPKRESGKHRYSSHPSEESPQAHRAPRDLSPIGSAPSGQSDTEKPPRSRSTSPDSRPISPDTVKRLLNFLKEVNTFQLCITALGFYNEEAFSKIGPLLQDLKFEILPRLTVSTPVTVGEEKPKSMSKDQCVGTARTALQASTTFIATALHFANKTDSQAKYTQLLKQADEALMTRQAASLIQEPGQPGKQQLQRGVDRKRVPTGSKPGQLPPWSNKQPPKTHLI